MLLKIPWYLQGTSRYLQGTSRVPPGYLQGTSRYLQGTSRVLQVPPGYLQGTSRVPPGYLQGTSRVPPGTSRVPPGYLPCVNPQDRKKTAAQDRVGVLIQWEYGGSDAQKRDLPPLGQCGLALQGKRFTQKNSACRAFSQLLLFRSAPGSGCRERPRR